MTPAQEQYLIQALVRALRDIRQGTPTKSQECDPASFYGDSSAYLKDRLDVRIAKLKAEGRI